MEAVPATIVDYAELFVRHAGRVLDSSTHPKQVWDVLLRESVVRTPPCRG